jgi:hypothetical protein
MRNILDANLTPKGRTIAENNWRTRLEKTVKLLLEQLTMTNMKKNQAKP